MQWSKVTLVGVGLLGGSLGLALRQRRLAGRVTGYVRRPASIDECMDVGAVDQVTLDLREAVADADLLVFCTPIAQMRSLAERLLPVVKPGVLATDVGSVKGQVVRDLEPLFARAGGCFVGSHPMAGSEKTGPAAARADLFQNAICVVTPTQNTPSVSADAVAGLWESVGARLMRLQPEAHDELVARSSHLPHLIAAQLASRVLDPSLPREQAALCATGFRDTTRIALGSPEMWRDITVANSRNLTRALDDFIASLQGLRQRVERGDGDAIEAFLKEARQRREGWQSASASTSSE
jgi:prephenate dehydrogenase